MAQFRMLPEAPAPQPQWPVYCSPRRLSPRVQTARPPFAGAKPRENFRTVAAAKQRGRRLRDSIPPAELIRTVLVGRITKLPSALSFHSTLSFVHPRVVSIGSPLEVYERIVTHLPAVTLR